ncbi:MAG TPA: hypothetical protein EYM54_06850 [Dehalococcoidia bacterium]|nr:hypothetical protein [Dehalococcoidia bacterium]
MAPPAARGIVRLSSGGTGASSTEAATAPPTNNAQW